MFFWLWKIIIIINRETKVKCNDKLTKKNRSLDCKFCILFSLTLVVKRLLKQTLPKSTVVKEAWYWLLYIPAGQRHRSTCICPWAGLCSETVQKECKVIYNNIIQKGREKKNISSSSCFHKWNSFLSLNSVYRNM